MEKLTAPAEPFDVRKALAHLTHWLPTQGPIKNFIHHNTLHAYQERPFHDALAVAAEMYGAKSYMDLAWYQQAYESGQITERALSTVLETFVTSTTERNDLRKKLFSLLEDCDSAPETLGRAGLHSHWSTLGVHIDSLTSPLMFRLLSCYLDQGISIWRMPHASDTFWNAIRRLVDESVLPFGPLSDPTCRSLLHGKAESVIEHCLEKIVGEPAGFETYLLEMLLAHPGWSGMVAMIEKEPGSLLIPRSITLLDFVAVEILLEYGWLLRKFGPDFAPILKKGEKPRPLPVEQAPRPSPHRYIKLLWQEALEWSYYEGVLAGLEANAIADPAWPAAKTQAFFCIDDRECSVRRHLEEVDPTVGTYAVAGFFGVDVMFQGADQIHPTQMCPVVITPKYLLKEKWIASQKKSFQGSRHWAASSNTLFRGWLSTQTLGLFSSVSLFLKVFRPSVGVQSLGQTAAVSSKTELGLLRNGDEKDSQGRFVGYSIDEMADRVRNVLSSAGLTSGYADLIVMVGHGSSSVNNPHFAAYDCGACSGRPGAPNARAFAWMANDRDVRKALVSRGIKLPDECYFVGAIHDTSRDELTYFDTEKLPAKQAAMLVTFQKNMEEALRRNAKERCRRFELVDSAVSNDGSVRHVRNRASSIFEPRPELNHATNASTIVGRRQATRGLFLDRRAFLNSYDPTQDPDGKTLCAILGAVVPVCGGINLEYFFSRVDHTVYGADTKLPHNVMSLLGVTNGVEGDLLTGLPTQMTEVHDPVRLLIVVEQTPEIALAAAKMNPATFEWIHNDWVRFACLCPKTGKTFLYRHGHFVPALKQVIPPAVYLDSLSVLRGQRGNIAVCRIASEATR